MQYFTHISRSRLLAAGTFLTLFVISGIVPGRVAAEVVGLPALEAPDSPTPGTSVEAHIPVSGQVIARETRKPVPDVTVSLFDGRNGRTFSQSLVNGSFLLRVSHAGAYGLTVTQRSIVLYAAEVRVGPKGLAWLKLIAQPPPLALSALEQERRRGDLDAQQIKEVQIARNAEVEARTADLKAQKIKEAQIARDEQVEAAQAAAVQAASIPKAR